MRSSKEGEQLIALSLWKRGLSLQEIAARVGKTPGTVARWLGVALRQPVSAIEAESRSRQAESIS